jgi:hypothetical protein
LRQEPSSGEGKLPIPALLARPVKRIATTASMSPTIPGPLNYSITRGHSGSPPAVLKKIQDLRLARLVA